MRTAVFLHAPLTIGVTVLALASCRPKCSDYCITGIEFVQAVQTSIANGVPLVANKPTFIRVYVKTGNAGPGPYRVNARLSVEDPATGQKHELSPTSNLGKAITVSASGSDRTKWSDSFTFWLPLGDTDEGARTFEARVYEADEPNPPAPHVWSATATFRPRVYTSVYGVVWAVTNNNDGQNAPLGPAAPWSDYYLHTAFVTNAFPVTNFTILPLPGIGRVPPSPQTFGNLTESRNWASQLLANLPVAIKINLLDNWDTGGLHGYAWGAASEEQNARTDHRAGKVMAQEIAHTFGLWCHTFDACYNYPHATTGHIDGSDVGFNLSGDLGRSDIHLVSLDGERDYFDGMTLGGRTGDFMSYNGPPLWVSAYTYCQLVHVLWKDDAGCSYVRTPDVTSTKESAGPHRVEAPAPADTSGRRDESRTTALFVAGVIAPDGRGHFERGEVLPWRPWGNPPHAASDWVVEMQDGRGTVVNRTPVPLYKGHLDKGTPIPFSVMLPFDAPERLAKKLVLRRGAAIIAQRDLSPDTLQVELKPLSAGALLDGVQRLTWSAAGASTDSTHATLLFSTDRRTWWPLNLGLRARRADIDTRTLPGTEHGYFKVRVSSFGQSKESDAIGPYRLARKPPVVDIVQPAAGAVPPQGQGVLLRAQAYSLEDGPMTDERAFTWSADDNIELGIGSWVVARDLRPGPHRIRVVVRDSTGLRSEAVMRILIGQDQAASD